MSRVLSVFRATLAADNLDSVVQVNGKTHKANEVSFVDDVAIPVFASAGNLCHKIGEVANRAYTVFTSFGMKLNFNPGKSEATVGFSGHGMKAARRS